MSIIISQAQISNITGKFNDFFDTMSVGKNSYLSIVKQPIQIFNNSNANILPGYGSDNFNTTDITYQPVTGIYPAVLIYGKNMRLDKVVADKFQLDLNSIYAKVKEDCKNYIMQGKTEKVYADGIAYIPQQTPVVQNFFGIRYYYFKLNEVQ